MLKRIAYFDWLTQIISAFCSNLNLNLQSALSLRHAKSTSSFDAFVFFFYHFLYSDFQLDAYRQVGNCNCAAKSLGPIFN